MPMRTLAQLVRQTFREWNENRVPRMGAAIAYYSVFSLAPLVLTAIGIASIVFGITQRSTARDQIRYGLYCFAMFVGGVFVAGWVMWLLRR